jgi:hypothetical protein
MTSIYQAKPTAELLDLFVAYGAAAAAYDSVLNRPRTTVAAAEFLAGETDRFSGQRVRIAEELATRPEPADEHDAVEVVEALLATATPFPAWAIDLVTKNAA